MNTMYELTTAAQELYEMLSNEDIDEQTFNDTLEGMGVDEKVDACCKVIKQLEADAKAVSEEKDRLAKRSQALKNNAKRVRESLVMFMQASGQSRIKTLLFSLSTRATQKLNISEDAVIPQAYIKVKTETDTAALKEAISKGVVVDGVTLDTNYSLTIR